MTSIQRFPGSHEGRCKSVVMNDMIWTVATGSGTDIEEQTQRTLAQLDLNLEEAGSDKHHIIEATVYLTKMEYKARMDKVWCSWIPADAGPCRACVGTDLAPGDLVEIKLLAVQS